MAHMTKELNFKLNCINVNTSGVAAIKVLGREGNSASTHRMGSTPGTTSGFPFPLLPPHRAALSPPKADL